ncbi:MAG TPA: Gldg family protein [Opitutaceae bacterium]|nr:Gldg family protein [Opitutaceae bacterium]
MKPGIKFLSLALLFAGLVLINYLASALPTRLDLTAERIYTLSPGTRTLLAKIEEPIQLDLYFSRSSTTLPIALKNYAERVREMLGQYVRSAHGKITLNVIDPKPDTPEEEKATAAGVAPQTWPSTGEQFYFGLVALQAEQQKVIPALVTDREQFLEYDLSQLLYQAQLLDRRKLGLLSGVPLRPEMDFMAMQSGQMPQSQMVISEWEKTFEIVPVEATADSLPENLDVLAIIHPQNLSRKLQFAIDQFLLSGKPVFLAVDPSSRYFRARGNQTAMMGGPPPNVSSDLPDLFKGWGIVYDPQSVVGDPVDATPLQTSPGSVVRYPIWLSLTKDSLNGTALPTSQLESMLLVEAGSFSLKDGTGLTLTPLLESSPQSGTLMAMAISMAQPEELGRQLTPSGKKVLAALIQGKFTSAFPDGLPAEAATKPGATPEEKPAGTAKDAKPEEKKPGGAAEAASKTPPALKTSVTKSTLLLIADTDWLFDDYSVRKLNFLGTTAAEPINDNLDFADNALDFLSGSQDLISIRGKGISLRPFKVVQAMEVKAQQKNQEQLTELEAKLSKVESQLTELEGKKTEGGRLVATPEITKAIDDFRHEQVKLRANRREIRKSLREGIEALENRLLILNLFATPVLVGGFGLWFYFRRKK